MHDQPNETTRQMPPTVAYELSLLVAFATGAEPNYCYANAWHALLELPWLHDARLVEGWVVLEQQAHLSVIEHCWCECPHTGIIDPSLVLLIRRGTPVHYFPAIRRDRAEVAMLPCRALPYVRSVGIYGIDGMGHPEYRAAYSAAYELARMHATENAPSKKLTVLPATLSFTEAPLRTLTVSSRTVFERDHEHEG